MREVIDMARQIKAIVNALSSSAALSATGFVLMQSSLTALAGAIALGLGLFLAASLGIVGLVSLLV